MRRCRLWCDIAVGGGCDTSSGASSGTLISRGVFPTEGKSLRAQTQISHTITDVLLQRIEKTHFSARALPIPELGKALFLWRLFPVSSGDLFHVFTCPVKSSLQLIFLYASICHLVISATKKLPLGYAHRSLRSPERKIKSWIFENDKCFHKV